MPNPTPQPPWWRRLLTELQPCLRVSARWREVLRRAWSVRLFAASVACQVLDVMLSTAGAFSGHYRASVALQLAGVVFAALGLWARLVYQQGLSNEG